MKRNVILTLIGMTALFGTNAVIFGANCANGDDPPPPKTEPNECFEWIYPHPDGSGRMLVSKLEGGTKTTVYGCQGNTVVVVSFSMSGYTRSSGHCP